MVIIFVAHKREDGAKEPLLEHLMKTAEYAKGFAQAFGVGEYAYTLGMAHDIGKYSEEFRKRILENGPKVDHATAGAKVLAEMGMYAAAMCAAGHHSGLLDYGSAGDMEGSGTFISRWKKAIPNYNAYKEEIHLQAVPDTRQIPDFQMAFFTRMLYSALVDADFLATESFMNCGKVERGGYDDIQALYKKLQQHIVRWQNPKEDLNKKRWDILQNALNKAEGDKGLYSLTVPTGGGKTVTSLAFALKHAIHCGLRRVIYVIPYTSIIEQTAQVFRDIVGENNVLEHHANVDFSKENDDDGWQDKHRLSTENWDAPIIVTTSVQFFESLFANKSSQCRKLHNISGSVVVFDEAQMIPINYLKPCVKVIENLVQSYNVTAVLCTATQPSLQKFFPKDMPVREICPAYKQLYTFFKRTSFKYIGKQEPGQLAKRMAKYKQALVITATRKEAAEVFSYLPKESSFHLSTLMYPLHRSLVLEEIRRRLKKNLPCLVVATSLIEAGVDVDFPVVFRAEAGLDSIIQAAGRCNREGTRRAEESIVYIYQPENTLSITAQNIAILHEVMQNYQDIGTPEAIQSYFDRLHTLKDELLDAKGILAAFDPAKGKNGRMLPFAWAAENFHLIEEPTKNILIAVETKAKELAESFRRQQFSKELFRQAGKYMVHVYPGHFKALRQAGDIQLLNDDFAVLLNENLYTKKTGLSLKADFGKGLYI